MGWKDNLNEFRKELGARNVREVIEWVAHIFRNKRGAKEVYDEVQKNGLIIDLLVEKRDGASVAFEVNRSSRLTERGVRQLKLMKSTLKDADDDIEFLPIFLDFGPLTDRAKQLLAEWKLDFWDEVALWNFLRDENLGFGAEETTSVQSSSDEGSADESIEEEGQELLEALEDIEPGSEWFQYQEFVHKAFRYLFGDELVRSEYEHTDSRGRNRRDIILVNDSESRFWSQLRKIYKAHYVVIDAKNHSKGVTKSEVVDIGHYLKAHGPGLFGILATRHGAGESAIDVRREMWVGSKKMILFMDDEDMIEMIKKGAGGGKPESVIRRKLDDFRLSV